MSHLVRVLRRDDGVAMVTVIGVASVITILAIGAFLISQQSLHESVIVREESHAFQLANAAIDVALANMQANGFVADDYPIRSQDQPGGALYGGSWETSVTELMDSEYLAVATGYASNGASETIEVKFFYLNIWEMNLAAGSNQSITAGGGGLNGTANIIGPFYAVGTIEMGGGACVLDGPLFIKGGDIVLTGTSEIGSDVVEGNPYSGPINVYCDGGLVGRPERFHVANQSQGVPTIVLPRVDDDYLNEMWTKAKAESVDNIMGYPGKSTVVNYESIGGDALTYQTMQPPNTATWSRAKAPNASLHYKYVGPDAGPSPMGTGSTPLIIGGGGSFGTGDDGPGGVDYLAGAHDDFWFDDVTNVLYVEGTVVVDGPVTIAENVTYRGNGAIIANGDILLTGEFIPATVGGQLDAAAAIGLITPGNIRCETPSSNKTIGDIPDLSGAFYAQGNVEFSHNILCIGSVVAGGIVFDHPNTHLITNPQLPSYLPESMPGRGMSLLTRGAWARR